MPLIEAYMVTAFSLDKLVGRELLENDLVKEVLEETKRKLADNSVYYGMIILLILLRIVDYINFLLDTTVWKKYITFFNLFYI